MKNKEISLIELLIVIAILGILSAAILSSLSTTKEKIKKIDDCNMYNNSTINRVPAKCLKYFGINSINN